MALALEELALVHGKVFLAAGPGRWLQTRHFYNYKLLLSKLK